jgi:hypothetical protein
MEFWHDFIFQGLVGLKGRHAGMPLQNWSAKFILRLLGVQNLFCDGLECKIYFAMAWSALLFCDDPFFGNASGLSLAP